MKIEEAIQTLKDIYPSQKQIVTGEYPHVAEGIDLAISALEKQIPKEVISHNGLNETRCPKCDSVFGYSLELDEYTGEKFDYCYGCGQALKWGE